MSRRPPSLRNAEYGMQQLARQNRSMIPGTAGGRLASASPVLHGGGTGNISDESADNSGASTVTGTFDRFPATGTLSSTLTSVTLSAVPQPGTLHLYLNGLALDEGVDYTVTDNVVTLITTGAGSGSVLVGRYLYTADLSTPVIDYTVFTDDFDRANSSTLGSDWTVYGGTWGISSNACVPITNTLGANKFTTALHNANSASVDLSVKVKRTSTTGWVEIVLAYDPVTDLGYRARFDMGGSFALRRTHKDDGPGADFDTVTTLFDPGSADGVYRTIRIVYDQPTATFQLYRDGTLQRTATDSSGGLAGTWVGMGTTSGGLDPVVEAFDDFSVSGV